MLRLPLRLRTLGLAGSLASLLIALNIWLVAADGGPPPSLSLPTLAWL
jgi:hypothetical protein